MESLYKKTMFKINKSVLRNAGRTFILLLFFFLCNVKLKAQESMIPEMSTPYLNQLIDTAKKYYPQVKIFKKRIDLAHINLQKTNLAWFDVFTVTVNYSPNGGTTSLNTPTLSGFQIGFFVNIGGLLQKPYLIKTAKEEVELAKLNQQENTMTIEADVKARYIKFVQTSVMLRVQSKIAIEAESFVKEARYKFEKGEVNFENFTKALIYETDNRKSVIDAEANLLLSRANLERRASI